MLKSLAQFEHALFNLSSSLDFIASGSAQARLDIYRNTVLENLVKALSITFPGVWRLLGEDCACQVARLFCKEKANLPRSGCLDDWGEAFPHFLSTVPALKDLAYLKDFAIYEWLQQLAYCASQRQCLSLDNLRNFSEEQWLTLKFRLPPGVFLFRSRYPIDSIAKLTAATPNEKPHTVNLAAGPSFALITRLNQEVCTFWLANSDWYFMKQLKSNTTLFKALNATLSHFPNFDLTQTLHWMLDKALFNLK